MEDPEKWAMTWRAYVRKHLHGKGKGGAARADAAVAGPETRG